MNLIKITQRTTIMAKPNKVVNNSVPFAIAYSFFFEDLPILSHLVQVKRQCDPAQP